MYIGKSCIQNRMFSMILTFLKCSNNSCKRVEHSYLNFQIRLLRENTKSAETCSASHRRAAGYRPSQDSQTCLPQIHRLFRLAVLRMTFCTELCVSFVCHTSHCHTLGTRRLLLCFVQTVLADVYLRMKITIFNHFLIILLSLEGYE